MCELFRLCKFDVRRKQGLVRSTADNVRPSSSHPLDCAPLGGAGLSRRNAHDGGADARTAIVEAAEPTCTYAGTALSNTTLPGSCETEVDYPFAMFVYELGSSLRTKKRNAGIPWRALLDHGVLLNITGRVRYIAADNRVLFDYHPPPNATYTAGWSACSSEYEYLAINGTSLFHQCGSESVYIGKPSGAECFPVYLKWIPPSSNGPGDTGAFAAPMVHTTVSVLSTVTRLPVMQPVTHIALAGIVSTSSTETPQGGASVSSETILQQVAATVQATATGDPQSEIGSGQQVSSIGTAVATSSSTPATQSAGAVSTTGSAASRSATSCKDALCVLSSAIGSEIPDATGVGEYIVNGLQPLSASSAGPASTSAAENSAPARETSVLPFTGNAQGLCRLRTSLMALASISSLLLLS
ncbi:hypothetical protein LTR56_009531 [Elasticomyces elasticus]|nr:hypothetical protein LTR56_009531 [Elasticomyces elasticus]KAK3657211.1 hypothetical protein LTR22_009385 [Elasticomyces elasticus]KAK4922242.1 hypothetical protein LTR49_010463 [Elasticomyces elasticus]KAK5760819.1 hypothetical protein LTS12_008995 [Elasticomyces elasticus]